MMLKKGALAIALAGYVMAGATAASAGQRAGSAAFPAVKASAQGATIAPAKRRVSKDAELVAGGLALPLIIGGIALISIVVVAASGGSDSSPN